MEAGKNQSDPFCPTAALFALNQNLTRCSARLRQTTLSIEPFERSPCRVVLAFGIGLSSTGDIWFFKWTNIKTVLRNVQIGHVCKMLLNGSALMQYLEKSVVLVYIFSI